MSAERGGHSGLADLLARLRPRRGPAPTPLPDQPLRELREVTEAADHVALFETAARAAGLHVRRTAAADVPAAVVEILRAGGARHAVIEAQPGTVLTPELAATLHNALASAGVTTSAARDDETLFTTDAAVTGAVAGIAETGTLVCVSGPASARGASLIPPLHIAVLDVGRVVGDLFDCFATLAATADLPANVNLISGPSKTADIESVLVIGVHGPGTVHVVLVE